VFKGLNFAHHSVFQVYFKHWRTDKCRNMLTPTVISSSGFPIKCETAAF